MELRLFFWASVFYWNFNDVTHMRLEWKHDFHNRQGTLDHGNGDRFLLSLGMVFDFILRLANRELT